MWDYVKDGVAVACLFGAGYGMLLLGHGFGG